MPSDVSLEKASELVGLPEDAIPIGGITVVGYIDGEGTGVFGLQVHGDSPYSQVIGLMQMAGHQLMHEANPTPCEDE